jgi:hypothetical protein
MKIIMIVGHQSSGTTAMYDCLIADKRYAAIHEDENNELYLHWNLRPEKEIRDLLRGLGKPLLTKPVNETARRGLGAVFQEFCDYDLQMVCMYRDPVSTYFSGILRTIRRNMRGAVGIDDGWMSIDFRNPVKWCQMWSRRYRERVFPALVEYGNRIAVVRYEDLIADRAVFDGVCRRVKSRGEYLFRADNGGGRYLHEFRDVIMENTSEVLAELDGWRTFRPGSAG